MGSEPGSLASPHAIVAWKLWYMLVCVQVLLLLDSTQANRMLQDQQLRRLQAFSDDTNSPRHAPPVQSFLVSDGSWVDCVPMEGQISAHHPALKDHVIQMRPSSPRSQTPTSLEVHPQLFAREYGGCPEGSIPVQRTDPNRPLLKQTPRLLFSSKAANGSAAKATHEYAVTGLPLSNNSYSGAYSVFSVNAPVLENPDEDFSLSQLWIVDGSWDDDTLSTVEAGWQKYPSSKHQNGTEPLAPHLFVYWTRDAYNKTGCYDLLCPGFVQTSNKWVIGGVMPAYTSLAQNAQIEIAVGLEVIYDPTPKHWALYLNNDPVGYWPAELYAGGRLGGTANLVQWGGEVVFYKNASNLTAHSKTAMGSGAFPEAGYPVAAYHRNITYVNATGHYLDANPSVLEKERLFDNPLCYNISVQQGAFTNWGTYFFFGGSGGSNPSCLGNR